MTMRDLVVLLFGEYNRIIRDLTFNVDFAWVLPYLGSSEEYGIHSAWAQYSVQFSYLVPDFAWFARVLVFSIVLWSFFRIVGGVIKCL